MSGVARAGDGNAIYGRTVKVSGQKTVATAGTQLALSATTDAIAGVFIKPLASNTGNVFLGDSTVDSTGFILAPTDPVFFYPCNNASELYVDVAVNGEGVSFWPV